MKTTWRSVVFSFVALFVATAASPLSAGDSGNHGQERDAWKGWRLRLNEAFEKVIGLDLSEMVITLPPNLFAPTLPDNGGEMQIVAVSPKLRRVFRQGGNELAVERVIKVTETFEGKYLIGVRCSPASEVLRAQLKLAERNGLVVDRVGDHTPAAEAGIQTNDVLVKADGTELGTVDDLHRAVENAGGKSLTLTLIRGGKHRAVVVTPKDLEPFADKLVPGKVAEVIKEPTKQKTPYIVLRDAKEGQYTILLLRPGSVEPPEDGGQPSEQVVPVVLWYIGGLLTQTQKDLKSLKRGDGSYVKAAAGDLEGRVQRIEQVAEDVLAYIEEMLRQTEEDLMSLKRGDGTYVKAAAAESSGQRTERVVEEVLQYVERTLDQTEKDLKSLKRTGGSYVKAAEAQGLEQRVERIERVLEEVLQYVEREIEEILQSGEKMLK